MISIGGGGVTEAGFEQYKRTIGAPIALGASLIGLITAYLGSQVGFDHIKDVADGLRGTSSASVEDAMKVLDVFYRGLPFAIGAALIVGLIAAGTQISFPGAGLLLALGALLASVIDSSTIPLALQSELARASTADRYLAAYLDFYGTGSFVLILIAGAAVGYATAGAYRLSEGRPLPWPPLRSTSGQ